MFLLKTGLYFKQFSNPPKDTFVTENMQHSNNTWEPIIETLLGGQNYEPVNDLNTDIS